MSLEDKKKKKAVNATLDKLSRDPKPLSTAYTVAKERIEGQRPGDVILAKRVLSWVTLAVRPLTVQELLCALEVDPDTGDLDFDGDLYDIQEILSVCAGLVSIEDESRVVRLVHYTIQTYLEDTLGTWYSTAEEEIVVTCLTYLSSTMFQDNALADGSTVRFDQFLDYAKTNWGKHALAVQDKVRIQACRFLSTTSLYSSIASTVPINQVTSPVQHTRKSNPVSFLGAMKYTAQHGLCLIMKELLESDQGEHARTLEKDQSWRPDQTLLATAAFSGHHDMVRLLIDKGHRLDGHDCEEVIHPVASRGFKDIFQLLFDKALSSGAMDGISQSSLRVAAYNGQLEIVQLLLDRHVNIEAADHFQPYGTALLAATAGNRLKVVQRLLKEGANVNAGTWFDDSPLHVAAEQGFTEILETLLTAEAEVDCYSDNGLTALCLAATHGYEEVAELLLRAGANPQLERQGRTPLMFAMQNGHESIVRLLIAHGDDARGHTLTQLLSFTRSHQYPWAMESSSQSTSEDEDEDDQSDFSFATDSEEESAGEQQLGQEISLIESNTVKRWSLSQDEIASIIHRRTF